MKSILNLFVFLFISLFSFSQISKINVGKSFKIHSRILNEKREIWIRLPESYSRKSARKYPVVYVLDGQSHFFSVAGMVSHLSGDGNAKIPEMIVVGVLSTLDRTRDLTPTHCAGEEPHVDSASCAFSGGNSNFISFFEKELMPYIQSKYNASNYNTLIGHSFGGLMVLNTMMTKTNLFNSYVAIDPSIWWDHQYMLKEVKQKTNSIDFKGKSLFLGIANTAPDGFDENQIKSDTSASTHHMRSIFSLQSFLDSTKTDLKFNWKYYPEDSHDSSPFIASYDGLRFIFKEFELKFVLTDSLKADPAILKKIEEYSNYLSETFGNQTPISSSLLLDLAFGYLDANLKKEALYLFELNAKYFPLDWNSYDCLGDYYSEISDYENALKFYKKAYSILPYFPIKMKIKNTKQNIR